MSYINNYNRILTFFLLIFYAFSSNSQENKHTIVIDPGHGGKDPGNTGNGYLEKNIALKIALGLGEVLEKNNNYNIIYTRKDDRFIDLFKNVKIKVKKNYNYLNNLGFAIGTRSSQSINKKYLKNIEQ